LFFSKALCEEWANKPTAEQDFGAFHRQVSAAAYHQSGRLKYRVHMLQAVSNTQIVVTRIGHMFFTAKSCAMSHLLLKNVNAKPTILLNISAA
jgi:mRNA-degrading endonuclease HigB of HigAB toxin-antitoxin module